MNKETDKEAHYEFNYANYQNGYKTEANIFLIVRYGINSCFILNDVFSAFYVVFICVSGAAPCIHSGSMGQAQPPPASVGVASTGLTEL